MSKENLEKRAETPPLGQSKTPRLALAVLATTLAGAPAAPDEAENLSKHFDERAMLLKEQAGLEAELERLEKQDQKMSYVPEGFAEEFFWSLKNDVLKLVSRMSLGERRGELVQKKIDIRNRLTAIRKELDRPPRNATAAELTAYIQKVQKEHGELKAKLEPYRGKLFEDITSSNSAFQSLLRIIALGMLEDYISELERNLQEAQGRLKQIREGAL